MRQQLQEALESLAKSTERLRARNDQLSDYLKGHTGPVARVVNAPAMSLEEVTARGKTYWDNLEKKRAQRAK